MTITTLLACLLALGVGFAIGAVWRSRKPAADPAMRDALGVTQVRIGALEAELNARLSERDALRDERNLLRTRVESDAATIATARAEAAEALRARAETESFVRNAQFPATLGGPPSLRGLTIAVVDEATTKFAGLASGELDMAGISPQMVPLARRDRTLEVLTYPVLFSSALFFNTTRLTTAPSW